MNLLNLTEKQQRIFGALVNGLTQTETSYYMNISKSSVSQTVAILITNKIIRKNGDKNYKIHYESLIPYNKIPESQFSQKWLSSKKYMGHCEVCGNRFYTDNKNQRFCSLICKGEAQSGPNHPQYTGGHKTIPYCWLYNSSLKERVKAFFNYRCAVCGKDERENFDRKGRLHKLAVHHVNYNRQACCPPYDKPKDKKFIPMCLFCHNKTSRTKDRKMWLEYLSKLIEEQYGGKCYFTKEEMKPEEQYYKF